MGTNLLVKPTGDNGRWIGVAFVLSQVEEPIPLYDKVTSGIELRWGIPLANFLSIGWINHLVAPNESTQGYFVKDLRQIFSLSFDNLSDIGTLPPLHWNFLTKKNFTSYVPNVTFSSNAFLTMGNKSLDLAIIDAIPVNLADSTIAKISQNYLESYADGSSASLSFVRILLVWENNQEKNKIIQAYVPQYLEWRDFNGAVYNSKVIPASWFFDVELRPTDFYRGDFIWTYSLDSQTHDEQGASTPSLIYSSFCFSKTSPTRSS